MAQLSNRILADFLQFSNLQLLQQERVQMRSPPLDDWWRPGKINATWKCRKEELESIYW